MYLNHYLKAFNPIRINRSNISNRYSYSKENFGAGMIALIISNEELDDIMKITKSFEGSGILIKGVSETIQNEAKQQKG